MTSLGPPGQEAEVESGWGLPRPPPQLSAGVFSH